MLVLPLLLLQVITPPQDMWTVMERVSVRWVREAADYELSIEERFHGSPDQTDSSRIRIRVPGRPDFVILGDSGWHPFQAMSDLSVLNQVIVKSPAQFRSNYFLLSSVLRGVDRLPMLLVFGNGGEDPDPLYIIALDSTGYPVLLFRDQLSVTEIADVDGDGAPEIVGNRSYAEGLGECSATYDPFSVYRVVRTGKLAVVYDLALSKRYNTRYYVWAGPGYDSKWKVDHCSGSYKLVPTTP